MAASHLAIGFTILGVAIWALAFWWGPVPDYMDLANRHILRIIAGAACFLVATVLGLICTTGGY